MKIIILPKAKGAAVIVNFMGQSVWATVHRHLAYCFTARLGEAVFR